MTGIITSTLLTVDKVKGPIVLDMYSLYLKIGVET